MKAIKNEMPVMLKSKYILFVFGFFELLVGFNFTIQLPYASNR